MLSTSTQHSLEKDLSEMFIESNKLLVKYMFLNHVEHVKKRQT